ncbi:MAG TPA: hypothetical protein VKG38_02630 [Solirubrobacteraceae bacterium]|nr:hypothetical protein [Solirubrobacteraceae bacterium]
MGFTRKALFIATFGLSGLVFKDNSKKERPAQAAQRRVRTKGQTKVTALKPPAARRQRTQGAQRPKPPAARRPKTQAARRPKTQAQRASTVSRAAGSGTASELERITELHGRGALTGEEFAAAKAKILGTNPTPDASGGRSVKFPTVEANVAAARRLADMAVPDGGGSVAAVGSD